jgi:putative hydrolase of the HAD superfamily
MTLQEFSASRLRSAGSQIRTVAFDAVGTVMYAMPSVSTAYCTILKELSGRDVEPAQVKSVLRQRLAARSGDGDLRTSEQSERTFWFSLIAELVPDVSRQQHCFDSLFGHFGEPENWRCYDDVEDSIRLLSDSGLKVVIASNFDERLHGVCRGLSALAPVSDYIVSSEVGWRKPARAFFDVVCERTQCSPDEILFVGDDPQNDIHGACRAGMPAVWIDRTGEPVGAVDVALPPASSERVWRVGTLRTLADCLALQP